MAASLSVGAIFVFVAVVSAIVVLAQCRRLDAITKTGPLAPDKANSNNKADQLEARNCAKLASHRPETPGRPASDATLPMDPNDTCLANAKRLNELEPEFVATTTGSAAMAQSALNSMMARQTPIDVPRPGSAFEAATSQRRHSYHRQHQFRSSLRQAAGAHQHQLARSSCLSSARFAAIHESLEHRLQFGARQEAGANDKSGGADIGSADNKWAGSLGRARPDVGVAKIKQRPGSAAGLIDRLWLRLQMKPTEGGARPAARWSAKARPTISMPVGGGAEPARLARSSLTGGSLTMIAQDGPTGAKPDGPSGANRQPAGGQLHPLSHLGGVVGGQAHHLVSSSQANLIQDSTTASDGTASSSGRSSSTGSHRQQPAGAHCPEPVSHGPDAPGYQHQHQHQLQQASPAWAHQQPDCCGGVYATNGLTYDQQRPYANEDPDHVHNLGPYSGAGQAQVAWASGAALAKALEHEQHQQQLAAGHYQLPMLMSEPYLAAAVAVVQQQQQHQDKIGRPCYATICNKQAPSANSICSPPASDNYGTLPTRPMPLGHHQKAALVPTSDAGDAYFESNYGTLLSRSSAYKTLGYAPGSTNSTNSSTMPANNDSTSSSPSSLTTHANSNSSHNLSTPHSHRQHHFSGYGHNETPPVASMINGASATANGFGVAQQCHPTPATMTIQSDGTTTTSSTTTTTPKSLKNGLATHV